MKKLGFGCMRLPILDNDDSKIDMEQFKKMVDKFIENGFTYFDTAFMYHKDMSETALNEALVKRYPRDAYTITTKLPVKDVKTKEDNERIFNIQLNRLGVDYVDYYLMHAMSNERFEYLKNNDLGTFEFMQKLKLDGRAKHIGFSFHDSSDVLDKILSETHKWVEYVQLQLNYLDWESEKVQARKCYEVAKKYNKQVIVMEPVRGGRLVSVPEDAKRIFNELNPNASIASYAIRFAASLDDVFMVLSGMSNIPQLEDNVSYMKDFKPLNDEEYKAIDKVVYKLKSTSTIACTGCKYCLENCPKLINIPEIFKLFNSSFSSQAEYENITTNIKMGKASDCLECGACENVCPQGLKIRDLLKDCKNKFLA